MDVNSLHIHKSGWALMLLHSYTCHFIVTPPSSPPPLSAHVRCTNCLPQMNPNTNKWFQNPTICSKMNELQYAAMLLCSTISCCRLHLLIDFKIKFAISMQCEQQFIFLQNSIVSNLQSGTIFFLFLLALFFASTMGVVRYEIEALRFRTRVLYAIRN